MHAIPRERVSASRVPASELIAGIEYASEIDASCTNTRGWIKRFYQRNAVTDKVKRTMTSGELTHFPRVKKETHQWKWPHADVNSFPGEIANRFRWDASSHKRVTQCHAIQGRRIDWRARYWRSRFESHYLEAEKISVSIDQFSRFLENI